MAHCTHGIEKLRSVAVYSEIIVTTWVVQFTSARAKSIMKLTSNWYIHLQSLFYES